MSHVILGQSLSRHQHKLSLVKLSKRSAVLPAVVSVYVLHICVPGKELVYSKPE